VARPVVREVGVKLRRKVRPVEREEAGLHVEAAFARMHAEDTRRRHLALRELPERILDRGDAHLGRQQPLDVGAREQQRRPHLLRRTGCPIAFQPEWPLFMYLASNPAARSLMAVLQPMWNPYAQ